MTFDQGSLAPVDLPPERVVLITGADRNLGKSMALSLLQGGARVVATALYGSLLDQLVEESGASERILAIEGDIASESDRDEVLRQALKRFGQIDVLVNNAAVTPETFWPNWLVDGEPRQWTLDAAFYRTFLEIDCIAPHAFMSAVLPQMLERGWGRIVNLSTALDVMLMFWPYGSAKAALEAQTAVLATQLAGTGVTANVLTPGAFVKPAPIHLPSGDVLTPDHGPEIMEAPIRWLASDASGQVNGKRVVAAKWGPGPVGAAEAVEPIGWGPLMQMPSGPVAEAIHAPGLQPDGAPRGSP